MNCLKKRLTHHPCIGEVFTQWVFMWHKHKIQDETSFILGLKGKLCFILHYFLFLWSHLDFSVTLLVSPKPKVLIQCLTYFADDFRVCTNYACFQVTKTRTLQDLMLTKLHTIHDTDSTI